MMVKELQHHLQQQQSTTTSSSSSGSGPSPRHGNIGTSQDMSCGTTSSDDYSDTCSMLEDELISTDMGGLTAEEIIQKKERIRLQTVSEFVKTETSYVRDLKLIVKLFIEPVRNKITNVEYNSVFGPTERILNLHRDILSEFEAIPAKSPQLQNVAEVLLKAVDHKDFTSLYVSFCKYQTNCHVAFEKLKNNSKVFSNCIESATTNRLSRGLSFQMLSIKPVQRITKWPLLLKSLIENTPQEHQDYKYLLIAYDKINNILDEINTQKRLMDEHTQDRTKLMDVESTLQFEEIKISDSQSRKFIKEGLVSRSIDKELYRCILFNDMLVFAKNKKKMATVKRIFYLSKIVVRNAKLDNNYNSSRGFEMLLMDKKDKIITLFFANENEKNDWFEQIYMYSNLVIDRNILSKYKWFLEKCPTYFLWTHSAGGVAGCRSSSGSISSLSSSRSNSNDNISNMTIFNNPTTTSGTPLSMSANNILSGNNKTKSSDSLNVDHITDSILKAEVTSGSLKGIKGLIIGPSQSPNGNGGSNNNISAGGSIGRSYLSGAKRSTDNSPNNTLTSPNISELESFSNILSPPPQLLSPTCISAMTPPHLSSSNLLNCSTSSVSSLSSNCSIGSSCTTATNTSSSTSSTLSSSSNSIQPPQQQQPVSIKSSGSGSFSRASSVPSFVSADDSMKPSPKKMPPTISGTMFTNSIAISSDDNDEELKMIESNCNHSSNTPQTNTTTPPLHKSPVNQITNISISREKPPVPPRTSPIVFNGREQHSSSPVVTTNIKKSQAPPLPPRGVPIPPPPPQSLAVNSPQVNLQLLQSMELPPPNRRSRSPSPVDRTFIINPNTNHCIDTNTISSISNKINSINNNINNHNNNNNNNNQNNSNGKILRCPSPLNTGPPITSQSTQQIPPFKPTPINTTIAPSLLPVLTYTNSQSHQNNHNLPISNSNTTQSQPNISHSSGSLNKVLGGGRLPPPPPGASLSTGNLLSLKPPPPLKVPDSLPSLPKPLLLPK